MSWLPKILMELTVLSVLVLSMMACSDDDSLVDTPLRNDELGERNADALLPDREEPLQSSDQPTVTQEIASTVHKTIMFSGDSSELDEAAKETLLQAKDMLDDGVPTQVTVLAVGSTQVSGGDPSRLTMERAEVVTDFLSERGVNVSDMQVRLQGLQSGQGENLERSQAGTLGSGGEVADAASVGEQEVVITIVSTSRPS